MYIILLCVFVHYVASYVFIQTARQKHHRIFLLTLSKAIFTLNIFPFTSFIILRHLGIRWHVMNVIKYHDLGKLFKKCIILAFGSIKCKSPSCWGSVAVSKRQTWPQEQETESWKQTGNTGSGERPLLSKPAASDFLQQGCCLCLLNVPRLGTTCSNAQEQEDISDLNHHRWYKSW